MSREKLQPASKLDASVTDHNYQMDVTASSSKRKSPNTPTKISTPPNKVVVSQVKDPDSALYDAIQKLTGKIDVLSAQLTATSDMLEKLSARTDKNEADIMDCNVKVAKLEITVPTLAKENEELKDRVLELERYKRRWNLKLQGLKEKYDENTRSEVIDILAKIAPQWAASVESTVDTVHRLGRKEDGKHRQIIIQFTARVHRDGFWKVTKNNKICKELGIYFKEDFCQQDRDARAAVWPKMERARAIGKNAYYRGHVGYIDGVRVTPDRPSSKVDKLK